MTVAEQQQNAARCYDSYTLLFRAHGHSRLVSQASNGLAALPCRIVQWLLFSVKFSFIAITAPQAV